MRDLILRIQTHGLLQVAERVARLAETDQRTGYTDLRFLKLGLISDSLREVLERSLKISSLTPDLRDLILRIRIFGSDGEFLLKLAQRLFKCVLFFRILENHPAQSEMD